MATQEHERHVAMGLARRAYLYGVYRVVFGGGLDPESVSRVFSRETVQALREVEDVLRAEDCTYLASKELTSFRIAVLDCVRENIACVEKMMAHAHGGDFIESLVDGHGTLFRIPGDSYVKPWESPYVGTKTMMFQESTLDVRRRYHEAGLKLSTERHFPDDHIASIIGYEARMSERAYAAYADGDDARVRSELDAQRGMLEAHVLTWIDSFAEDVAKKDASGVFAAFALGMDAFSRTDEEFCLRLQADLADAGNGGAADDGGNVFASDQNDSVASDA